MSALILPLPYEPAIPLARWDSLDQPSRRAAETDYWGRLFLLTILACCGASFVIGFSNALSTMVLVGFAAALLGLKLPTVGVFGISILCTLDAVTRPLLLATGGVLRWNTLNYWLLIVILLGCPLALRMRDPHTRLLQALMLVVGMGVLLSGQWIQGLQHMLGATIAFGLLIYFFRARQYPGVWYWTAVLCGTLSALGCFSFVSSGAFENVDRNAWSFFPLTGIFAICMGFEESKQRRWGQVLLGILAAANLVWVFLSTSRGGFFIAACCVLYLVTQVSSMGKRLQLMVLAAAMVVPLANQFSGMSDRMLERLDKMFDSQYSAVQRTSGRSELAYAAVELFWTHPIVGVGTGAFASAWAELPQSRSAEFSRGREVQAHSGWAKTLSENGLLGITFHVAYVLSFSLLGRGTSARGLGLLVTIALTVAFASTEFQNKTLWFFASGVTVLAHYRPWWTDNYWYWWADHFDEHGDPWPGPGGCP